MDFKTRDQLVFDPPPIGTVLYSPGLPQSGNVLIDRGPYGNHGTITGATWSRLPSGLWVLSFDGNDFIDCGDSSVFRSASNVTLEAWVSTDSIGATQCFACGIPFSGAGWVAPYYGYAIYRSGDSLRIGYNDGASPQDTNIGTIQTGTMYHAVFTDDGTTTRGYFNGNETATVNPVGDITYSGTPAFVIGTRNADGLGFYWVGKIGLVRSYNQALSAAQIQGHYSQERHLFGV